MNKTKEKFKARIKSEKNPLALNISQNTAFLICGNYSDRKTTLKKKKKKEKQEYHSCNLPMLTLEELQQFIAQVQVCQ